MIDFCLVDMSCNCDNSENLVWGFLCKSSGLAHVIAIWQYLLPRTIGAVWSNDYVVSNFLDRHWNSVSIY
jgi:hypothetical protein